MRVLFLSCVFPQPYEPTHGVFCENLCRSIAAEHRLVVVAPRLWTEQLGHWFRCPLACAAGNTIAPGLTSHRPIYFYPPKVLQWTYDWWMWQSIRHVIRHVLAEFAPDCILSYWAHPDGAVAVRAGRLAGVPVGIIVGGSDVLLLTQDLRRRRTIAQALQSAQAVFGVSEDLRNKVVDLGVASGRAHLVRQGVDRDLFYPGDRQAARARLGLPAATPVLLWVGKMLPVKGLEILLEASARLQQQGLDFRLYLIGDGPLRPSLETECRRRGLDRVVTFPGRRPPRDLPDWYRAADLTVLSSWSEGIPNVLRESLACGTPFVATQVGGVAEIAEPGRDVLVPAGDPAALAQGVADALRCRPVFDPAQARFDSWADNARAMLAILRPDLVNGFAPSARR